MEDGWFLHGDIEHHVMHYCRSVSTIKRSSSIPGLCLCYGGALNPFQEVGWHVKVKPIRSPCRSEVTRRRTKTQSSPRYSWKDQSSTCGRRACAKTMTQWLVAFISLCVSVCICVPVWDFVFLINAKHYSKTPCWGRCRMPTFDRGHCVGTGSDWRRGRMQYQRITEGNTFWFMKWKRDAQNKSKIGPDQFHSNNCWSLSSCNASSTQGNVSMQKMWCIWIEMLLGARCLFSVPTGRECLTA